MLEEEWSAYLASDRPGYFAICSLDVELAAHSGATTTTVLVSRGYLEKILSKHNISTTDLPAVKMTIEHGVAIGDRDKHLTFFYENASKQNFKATIKATHALDEIFLCTFHKIRNEEVERKLRQLAHKRLLRRDK